MFIHPGHRDACQAVVPVDSRYRMAQVQRNAVIIQALLHIAGQTAGIWLDLKHGLDMSAFQRKPAGHNHADVPGSQDDHFLCGHYIAEVNISLGNPCRKHTGRALTGDSQSASGTLPASHGKDHGLGPPYLKTPACCCRHCPVLCHLQNGCVRDVRNP